jgi:ATP-dependent helicase/nuclease subunit A
MPIPKQSLLKDKASRDAIVEQLDVNMLVEAGAGAGKTGSMARRLTAMIASGICRIEDIAAVTFTRKAAAELVGRCRIELEWRLARETGERAQRLRQALAAMERMFAGTIHAFCAHLLRERPVEAGVAPQFSELEDAEDTIVRNRAWREFLEQQRVSGSSILAELEIAQVRPQDLDGAFGTLCAYPDVEFPAGNAPLPEADPTWALVDRFATELRSRLPGAIDPETTCPIQKQARDFLSILQWQDRNRPAVLARLLSGWDKNYKATQKWWKSKSIALEAASVVQQFQAEAIVPFLSAWRQYLYRLIVTLAGEARSFAAESRRRAAALNYEDLLQRTAEVLRSNRDVRESLQLKYTRIFVDEFQDTDPIQTEIVFLLAAEPGADSDWTQVPLRSGALFLVGDPKQSIFRFRRADIDIYERAKQRIRETRGVVVELTTCFRAIPALSTWANGVFKSLFPTAAIPQQPSYRDLNGVNEPGEAPCGIIQLCLPAAIERKQVPSTDAQAISAYIASEVAAGRRKWGDFLVLTRKKEHLGLYADALERGHVSYEVSGSEAFQDSASVDALAALLYALANPDDAPSLVGVLRGPLFGLDDGTLFEYRRQGGQLLLNAPIDPNSSGSLVEALRNMQEMYRWTRKLPVGTAVERIIENTGLLARASAESAGGGEAGKLIFALDCLREASETGASFAQAVEELETRLGAGEADPPTLEPGRQDVVRLMNLHKAKGLEGKVVFLADPLAGVRPRADIHIVREGNRARGYLQVMRRKGEYQIEVLAEPKGWTAHEEAELTYVTAEELRLLYVACTRPMEMLVVSRWEKDDQRSVRPWETLAPFLASAPRLELPPPVEVAPAPVHGNINADRLAACAEREKLFASLLLPTSIVEAVSMLAGGGTHEAAVPGEPYGPAWGRIVHALLQYAALAPGCSREDLEGRARWHVMGDPLAQPFADGAVATVLNVMTSAFWAHISEATARLTEVPLMTETPASSPRRLETGVIDLALRFDADWEVIDYKTEAGDIDLLANRYGEQVRAYAACWERITGERVRFAGIYSLRNNALSRNCHA